MSNYAEYRAGTNPRDADSRFAAQIARGTEPPGTPVEGVVLRWNSIADRTYAVWRTLDLAHTNFDQIATGVLATPPENWYSVPVASNANAAFFRIEVEAPKLFGDPGGKFEEHGQAITCTLFHSPRAI